MCFLFSIYMRYKKQVFFYKETNKIFICINAHITNIPVTRLKLPSQIYHKAYHYT